MMYNFNLIPDHFQTIGVFLTKEVKLILQTNQHSFKFLKIKSYRGLSKSLLVFQGDLINTKELKKGYLEYTIKNPKNNIEISFSTTTLLCNYGTGNFYKDFSLIIDLSSTNTSQILLVDLTKTKITRKRKGTYT